jgi:hypothetical protein
MDDAEETSTGGADEETRDADQETPDTDVEAATDAGITARYYETPSERILAFESSGGTAVVAQNREGYAMLKVRPTEEGDELERYYGFDVALDHVAELLGVRPDALPVPNAAADMGM